MIQDEIPILFIRKFNFEFLLKEPLKPLYFKVGGTALESTHQTWRLEGIINKLINIGLDQLNIERTYIDINKINISL